MHFISFLCLALIQIACIIHAIKRGFSYHYILSVLMFPLIGAVIHLMVEYILPFKDKLKQNLSVKKLKKQKPESLEILRGKAEAFPSFENQYQLIQALIKGNCKLEALTLLEKLQTGIYADCEKLSECRERIRS